MEVSLDVLRNSGVPVRVAKLAEDGTPLRDADGANVTEVRHLRFTANSIAILEDAFAVYETKAIDGSTLVLNGDRALARMSTEKPMSCIRIVFGAAWEIAPQEAGKMMLTDEQGQYLAAINAALAIAQGMDPTLATEMIKLGIEVAAESKAKMAEALSALTSVSLGQTGLVPGADSDDTSMSSGS